ncbi:hypothetical protein [uncultured Dokdonia sp.]|uniref:hypothetical protein n=1 Tax=uncultured Dokdonia sp. TaxID=575653 RepID=UPI002616DE26|nr:hypothetical protein [uncultured Dokdonia sp.]
MTFFDLESHPDIISFHWNKLKPILTKRIEDSSLNRYLKKFIVDNLEDIICSKPNELKRINTNFKRHKYYKNSLKGKVKAIFDYNSFVTKKESKGGYDGYDLAEKLGIRTCLYCNRMFTVTIKKSKLKKDKITRPQFDHFIDKGKNPLLGLSIYNLVPSCNICNSTLKGRKEFTLNSYIHPYEDNCLDDYTYKFIPYDTDSILGNSSRLEVEIEIKNLNSSIGKKIKKSIDVFKLNEIMSGHSEELKDLFEIRYRFSERYFLELFNTYKTLGLDRKDIYRVVFGAEYLEKDFGKRPFSKLKKDILKELNII